MTSNNPALSLAIAEAVKFIADHSEKTAFAAGVGGMETAGAIVSYLAEHPEKIDDFVAGGFLALPELLHREGRLTWHGANGRIFSPEFARRQVVITKLAKGSPA